MNKRRIALLLFCSLQVSALSSLMPVFAAPPTVQSLGTFSNVVHTKGGEDEHAMGYTVSLWQQANRLVGVFTSQYGLADMKPCGVLEHVEHDQKDGTLKFDCKMSTGTTMFKKKEVATRELFKFAGKLDRSVLTGKLTELDMLDQKHKPQVFAVKLRKTNGVDASQIKTTDYLHWEVEVAEQLKASGPKW